MSGAGLVAIVCTAQALAQIGASVWPALLPNMMQLWALTYSEAAWITAIFLAAYMVAVPVLVPQTARFDPRAVYLLGVGLTCVGHLLFGLFADGFWTAFFARALTGIGWARTYMTGLKLLADKVEGRLMSRATVGYAASIGISGALSFSFADVLASSLGWTAPFLAAAVSAACAWLLVLCTVPGGAPPHDESKSGSLFDFRPVLRNRSAMAYALTYCVHTLEYHAIRGWGVAFLGFVAGSAGVAGSIVSPATVLTILGILATVATVMGNELSIRFGRRRLIAGALIACIACACLLGLAAPQSYLVAIVLILIYGFMISLNFVVADGRNRGAAQNPRGAGRRWLSIPVSDILAASWDRSSSAGRSISPEACHRVAGRWLSQSSGLCVLCSLIVSRS